MTYERLQRFMHCSLTFLTPRGLQKSTGKGKRRVPPVWEKIPGGSVGYCLQARRNGIGKRRVGLSQNSWMWLWDGHSSPPGPLPWPLGRDWYKQVYPYSPLYVKYLILFTHWALERTAGSGSLRNFDLSSHFQNGAPSLGGLALSGT